MHPVLKFIYGDNKYGRCLLSYFQSIGMHIDYFVQSEDLNCKNTVDTPLISYSEMIKIAGKKIIYVAIEDNNDITELKRKLSKYSKSIKVYICNKFIREKLLIESDKSRYCIICNNYIKEFKPSGIDGDIFMSHHIIGGGYRKDCKCPICGVRDRIRWLYYVLKNKSDIFQISGRVLHIAPEKAIVNYISRNKNVDYYTCDIVPGRATHTTDITNLSYKDSMFDYVISNHVLEHVADEEKAVSEVKRVLKPEGKWIFSFPICTDMKTYEDKSIISCEARLKAYGQEDHVRLYGNDYIKRFSNYGLQLDIYTPKNELDKTIIDNYGFIEDDVIIIAKKRV